MQKINLNHFSINSTQVYTARHLKKARSKSDLDLFFALAWESALYCVIRKRPVIRFLVQPREITQQAGREHVDDKGSTRNKKNCNVTHSTSSSNTNQKPRLPPPPQQQLRSASIKHKVAAPLILASRFHPLRV